MAEITAKWLDAIDPAAAYRGLQGSPNWYQTAERLKAAADVLMARADEQDRPYWKAVEVAIKDAYSSPEGGAYIEADLPDWQTPQLLYGYAIENMLKALLVAQNPDLQSATRLHDLLNSHDGIALAFQADFLVSDAERNLLFRLQQMVVWAGRYPTATKLKWHIEANSKGGPPFGLINPIIDHPVMHALYERLRAAVLERIGPAPNRRIWLQLPAMETHDQQC